MLLGGLSQILFSDNVPFLKESMCLNRRNRFEPCGLCESACAFDALKISAGFYLPVIDEGKCTACGLCASVCPSEALRLRDYKIFRDLTANETVKCLKAGGNFCVKALSPALISAIVIVNKGINFVMPCQNCKLSANVSGAIRYFNFDTAFRFLDSLKVSHDVRIVRDESFESECSRRDMLAMMFARGKRKGSNVLEDVIFHDKNNIFLAREFLSDRLKDSNAEISPGVFYDFSVYESCDACGMCEALCPSGAWSLKKSESKAELTFNAVSCSGCMLCVKKCPVKAIKLREKFSWPIESKVKKEFQRVRCRHCGKWFTVNEPEQELCASCSGRK